MTSTESTTKALHLYRSLLRATTYLPDEAARIYIREYVGRRFRKAARITPDRLQNAARGVNRLQQACDGHTPALRSVLQHTYGLSGPRRKELIQRLRALENPPDSPMRLSPLEQFVRSRPPAEHIRKPIRQVKPEIPAVNIWGRPLPKRRVANIKRRFQHELDEKLTPPIPQRQWERLRDLANGNIIYTGPPKRRARPVEQQDFEFLKYLTEPIRKFERKQPVNKHVLSARFMRREWALLWNSSALLEPPTDDKPSWKITWGSGRSPLSRGKISTAGYKDMELFEGVEAQQATSDGKQKSKRNQKKAVPVAKKDS